MIENGGWCGVWGCMIHTPPTSLQTFDFNQISCKPVCNTSTLSWSSAGQIFQQIAQKFALDQFSLDWWLKPWNTHPIHTWTPKTPADSEQADRSTQIVCLSSAGPTDTLTNLQRTSWFETTCKEYIVLYGWSMIIYFDSKFEVTQHSFCAWPALSIKCMYWCCYQNCGFWLFDSCTLSYLHFPLRRQMYIHVL